MNAVIHIIGNNIFRSLQEVPFDHCFNALVHNQALDLGQQIALTDNAVLIGVVPDLSLYKDIQCDDLKIHTELSANNTMVEKKLGSVRVQC